MTNSGVRVGARCMNPAGAADAVQVAAFLAYQGAGAGRVAEAGTGSGAVAAAAAGDPDVEGMTSAQAAIDQFVVGRVVEVAHSTPWANLAGILQDHVSREEWSAVEGYQGNCASTDTVPVGVDELNARDECRYLLGMAFYKLGVAKGDEEGDQSAEEAAYYNKALQVLNGYREDSMFINNVKSVKAICYNNLGILSVDHGEALELFKASVEVNYSLLESRVADAEVIGNYKSSVGNMLKCVQFCIEHKKISEAGVFKLCELYLARTNDVAATVISSDLDAGASIYEISLEICALVDRFERKSFIVEASRGRALVELGCVETRKGDSVGASRRFLQAISDLESYSNAQEVPGSLEIADIDPKWLLVILKTLGDAYNYIGVQTADVAQRALFLPAAEESYKEVLVKAEGSTDDFIVGMREVVEPRFAVLHFNRLSGEAEKCFSEGDYSSAVDSYKRMLLLFDFLELGPAALNAKKAQVKEALGDALHNGVAHREFSELTVDELRAVKDVYKEAIDLFEAGSEAQNRVRIKNVRYMFWWALACKKSGNSAAARETLGLAKVWFDEIPVVATLADTELGKELDAVRAEIAG